MKNYKKLLTIAIVTILYFSTIPLYASESLDKNYQNSNLNSTYTIIEEKILKEGEFFKETLKYPHLKINEDNMKKESYNPKFIENINKEIYRYISDFQKEFEKRSKEFNKLYYKNKAHKDSKKLPYEAYSYYHVAYNKNNYLSIPLLTEDFSYVDGATKLKSFNYDLYNQQPLTLKDLFKEGIDYKKIVNDFVNQQIAKDDKPYFDGKQGVEGFKTISDDQDFYISEDGIVVYFQTCEIAPCYVGVPKFTMTWSEFNDVLKPALTL